jgi:hypothetical protein
MLPDTPHPEQGIVPWRVGIHTSRRRDLRVFANATLESRPLSHSIPRSFQRRVNRRTAPPHPSPKDWDDRATRLLQVRSG